MHKSLPYTTQTIKTPQCCKHQHAVWLALYFVVYSFARRSFFCCRLKDVEHSEGKLYLVFEWLDKDLKKYMDSVKGALNKQLIKVRERVTQHTQSAELKQKPNTNTHNCHFCLAWFGSRPLPAPQSYMYQILRGMAFCHALGVMHRDMKPQNLLVDRHGTLKIADFGLARAFIVPIREYTHEVVTLWYRAPEILLGQRQYSPAVDIWSIGAIFVEMINKRPLWPGDSEIDELFRIFRTLGTPTEQMWPGVTSLPDYKSSFPKWPANKVARVVPSMAKDPHAVDLLTQMLHYDPVKRISAKAALNHPYFDDLDKTAL